MRGLLNSVTHASLIVAVAFILGCSSVPGEDSGGKDERPGEHLFQMRAFPYDTLNRKAIADGLNRWHNSVTAQRNNDRPWESIGPFNIGGRITALTLHPVDTNIIYAGASVGGVWKSNDAGRTWEVVFEEPGALSIGALAISRSNPEIIYAGTGEANASATSGAFFGNGVWKSEDGGESWVHLGLEASSHIGRIVVDSDDPDRVFVAAGGLLYGKNDERGVYRSLDGGQSWKRTLFVSDSTACIDLVLNPLNDQILFAAMWERLRYPYSRSYSGITSGIHRSTDGGTTWERLTGGLPNDPNVGRIGIAMSDADNSTVYAVYTTEPSTNRFAGLYKSDDMGEIWSREDDGTLSGIFSSFGWFFGNVRAHPFNPDQVFILGLQNWVSANGGRNWSQLTNNGVMHVDQHALAIHPLHTNFIVAGNDGGVYVSNNAGASWRHCDNMPISQFYATEIDPQQYHRVYGGMQDNGTAVTRQGAADAWERIFGGDGFRVNVDPTDSNMIYCEAQNGYLVRSFDGGFSFWDATFGIDFEDRNNWNTPVILNPVRPSTLYYGTQRLYISRDRADSWHAISGDLTDPETSANDYGTISAIAVAYSDTNVIYVGTDDGFIQRTTNEGGAWKVVSGDLPRRYVTQVAVDESDPMHVYATLSGYRSVDYLPHIFESSNGGETWTDISNGLPEVPVNDVVIDPHVYGNLYVATDQGVWVSENNGQSWEVLGTGFPSSVVNDLDFHPESRTLVAATFGRSQFRYQLDEISSTGNKPRSILELSVFPNPARDQITLQLGGRSGIRANGKIEIVDMAGRVRHTARLDNSETAETLDVTMLEPGNYILRTTGEEFTGIAKFQVIR